MVIAILALLLGLVLGGVFSIVRESQDVGYINVGVSDSVHGYKIVEHPKMIAEINYANPCGGGNKAKPHPWHIPGPYPTVMIN